MIPVLLMGEEGKTAHKRASFCWKSQIYRVVRKQTSLMTKLDLIRTWLVTLMLQIFV
jgi:hypothetical protein